MDKIIFPIDNNNYPIVEYLNRNNDCILSSVSGSFLIDESFNKVNNNDNSDISVIDIYEVEFKNIKTLYLLETELLIISSEIYDYIFSQVLKYNIKIVYREDNINLQNIDKSCIDILSQKIKNDFFYSSDYKQFYQSQIPVILINSVVRNTEVDRIAYKLKNSLEKRGVRSTTIMSDKNAVLTGCFVFPPRVLDVMEPFIIKILEMNAFIKNLSETEAPDLFIININQGIFKLNNDYLNGFGELAFIISEACVVDYSICDVPIGLASDTQLNTIRETMINRNLYPVDIFSINSIEVNFESLFQIGYEIPYFHLNKSNNKVIINDEVFNSKIFDNDILEKICNDIFHKLGGC